MSATEAEVKNTPPPVKADRTREAPAVYDAEARQLIPVTLLLDDGRYNLALVCEPVTDAVMLQYSRMCEEAGAVESDEEEEDGSAQLSGYAKALEWLFTALMSDLEGIGEDGEERPDDWREIFGPLEKQEIIDKAVFKLEPVEPPAKKKKRRPVWGSHLRAVVNRFRVPFNGGTVEVSHTLRKADAKQMGEFAALHTRTLVAIRSRAGDANLQKYAEGYDALHVSHEGYKGAVPMHHKAVAYIAHMTRQGAAVRKN